MNLIYLNLSFIEMKYKKTIAAKLKNTQTIVSSIILTIHIAKLRIFNIVPTNSSKLKTIYLSF